MKISKNILFILVLLLLCSCSTPVLQPEYNTTSAKIGTLSESISLQITENILSDAETAKRRSAVSRAMVLPFVSGITKKGENQVGDTSMYKLQKPITEVFYEMFFKALNGKILNIDNEADKTLKIEINKFEFINANDGEGGLKNLGIIVISVSAQNLDNSTEEILIETSNLKDFGHVGTVDEMDSLVSETISMAIDKTLSDIRISKVIGLKM